jgi:hypothetical protein
MMPMIIDKKFVVSGFLTLHGLRDDETTDEKSNYLDHRYFPVSQG